MRTARNWVKSVPIRSCAVQRTFEVPPTEPVIIEAVLRHTELPHSSHGTKDFLCRALALPDPVQPQFESPDWVASGSSSDKSVHLSSYLFDIEPELLRSELRPGATDEGNGEQEGRSRFSSLSTSCRDRVRNGHDTPNDLERQGVDCRHGGGEGGTCWTTLRWDALGRLWRYRESARAQGSPTESLHTTRAAPRLPATVQRHFLECLPTTPSSPVRSRDSLVGWTCVVVRGSYRVSSPVLIASGGVLSCECRGQGRERRAGPSSSSLPPRPLRFPSTSP